MSVKTYGSLASQTDPAALLSQLPAYTGATVRSLLFKLPLGRIQVEGLVGRRRRPRAPGSIPTQDRLRQAGHLHRRAEPTLRPRTASATTARLTIPAHQGHDASIGTGAELRRRRRGRRKYGWRRARPSRVHELRAGRIHDLLAPPERQVLRQTRLSADPPKDSPASDAKAGTPAAGSVGPEGNARWRPARVAVQPTVVSVRRPMPTARSRSPTRTAPSSSPIPTAPARPRCRTAPVVWTIPGVRNGRRRRTWPAAIDLGGVDDARRRSWGASTGASRGGDDDAGTLGRASTGRRAGSPCSS